MNIFDQFEEMPAHSTSTIKYISLLIVCTIVSIAGVALGAPQVLWVWLIPFFAYDESQKCRCPDCRGETPPEQREDATEIIKRRYAEGDLTDEELDVALGRIEGVSEMDRKEAEDLLETELR